MYDLKKNLALWNIDIDDEQLDTLDKYFDILILWNSRINLTSITAKEDVYSKHFADSICLLRYIDISGKSFLDVGSGAGFPGIPLKIMRPDCKMVLLDSLSKRVMFLNEVISELGLKKIKAVHGRAEDLARDAKFREKFDFVSSRAVANLSTLSEYCLPFVKIKGTFISYKSGNVDDEASAADKAVSVLGGSVRETEKFIIPGSAYERSFVFIDKIKNTPGTYPRKAGTPLKKPL